MGFGLVKNINWKQFRIPISHSSSIRKHDVSSSDLSKEEINEILESPYETNYTYSESLAYKPLFGNREYIHPRLCRRFSATRTSNNNKNPIFILLFLPLLSFFLAGYHLQQWSNTDGMETIMDPLLVENEYVLAISQDLENQNLQINPAELCPIIESPSLNVREQKEVESNVTITNLEEVMNVNHPYYWLHVRIEYKTLTRFKFNKKSMSLLPDYHTEWRSTFISLKATINPFLYSISKLIG